MISEEKIQKALNESYYNIGPNAYYGNGFIKGVEFAESEYKELKAQRDQLIKVLEMWQRVRVTDQLEYNAARHVTQGTLNKIKGE